MIKQGDNSDKATFMILLAVLITGLSMVAYACYSFPSDMQVFKIPRDLHLYQQYIERDTFINKIAFAGAISVILSGIALAIHQTARQEHRSNNDPNR